MRSDDTTTVIDVFDLGAEAWAELYTYAPAPERSAGIPTHAHAGYQFGISPDFPGFYRYLGAWRPVPIGSVHVIHPGEAHATKSPAARTRSVHFPMLNLSPKQLRRSLLRGRGHVVGEPFVDNGVIEDPALFLAWRRFFALLQDRAPRLSWEAALDRAVCELFEGYSGAMPVPRFGRNDRHADGARDWLHAHVDLDIGIESLSAIVGTTPATLRYAFVRRFGMPMHRYAMFLRTQRVAAALRAGMRAADAAFAHGFSDQSHLNRWFRRLYGTTPGLYRVVKKT